MSQTDKANAHLRFSLGGDVSGYVFSGECQRFGQHFLAVAGVFLAARGDLNADHAVVVTFGDVSERFNNPLVTVAGKQVFIGGGAGPVGQVHVGEPRAQQFNGGQRVHFGGGGVGEVPRDVVVILRDRIIVG